MTDPETFYHTAAARKAFTAQLPAETETLVIGGGLAGLTTAEALAGKGRAVTVIEARSVGWGASGRNGGFVSAGFAEGMDAVAARVGEADAVTLYRLTQDGVARVRATIDRLGRDDLVGGTGWLKVVRHDGADGLRSRQARARDRFGVELEFLDRARLQDLLVTDRYRAALLDPDPFHIQPLGYARALAGSAEEAGAAIVEGCCAMAIERRGGGWRVETERGTVETRHVVLAFSAYGRGLWPALDRAILPVATYVVASDPAPDRLSAAIRFSGCIADTRRAGDYYRVVDHGGGRRLIWGGRITTRRSLPPHLVDALRRDILSVYPQLEGLSLPHAWMGLMGYTRVKMPLIGKLEPGLWACTAFGGHGLNTTAMGGDLIAAAIADGDDRWRLFTAFHTRWGGGWPGRIAAQGAYWAMQARDRWDER